MTAQIDARTGCKALLVGIYHALKCCRRLACVPRGCGTALLQPVTRQPAAPRVASVDGITSRNDNAVAMEHLARRGIARLISRLLGATRGGHPSCAVPAPERPRRIVQDEAGRALRRAHLREVRRQQDGRLAGCLPSENCVSSSAIKSPAQFDAPWLFSPATRDADKAFEELVKAAQASPDLKIAETDPARRYLRGLPRRSQISNYKATDVDDLEVLISAEKGLVFHRSASRESVFFFPPQNIYSVPLGDNGSNRGRLEALRKALGWESTNPRPEEEEDLAAFLRRLNLGCS